MALSSSVRETRLGVILGIIVASYLMIGIDMSIVNVALPTMRSALGFSTVGLAWVVNAYMLAYGGLLFLGGRSGDIVGRKRSLLFGVILFTAASALGGFAPSAWWLLVSRVLQGVGAAFAAPSTMALLITSFPEGQPRNRALSFYSAAASLGSIVGLALGGVLTGLLSWRWVFFVNVPVGIALAILVPIVLRETERREGRFDLAGAVSSTVGMTSLVFGLVRAASSGWGNPLAIAAFALAAVLLGFFIRHEQRTAEPLLPLGLFSDRTRVGAYLALLLIIAGNFGTFFFSTQFIQGVLRFSPLQAGAAYLPLAGMILITVRIVPRLLKRWEPWRLIMTGTFLQAVGLLWLTRLSAESTYVGGLLGPLVLIGLASGLCIMPLNVTALSGVERKESGAASGLAQTMMTVGGSLGLAILVTVFGATSSGTNGFGDAFMRGIAVSLRTAAGFAMAGFIVAAFLIRPVRARRTAVRTSDPDINKSIVRRYFEMWNTGNVSRIHDILHPQWVDHSNAQIRGAHDVPAELLKTRAECPDFHIGVETILSEGDRVAVHSTTRGACQDSESRGIWLIRLEGDKMAEMWKAQEMAG
ncbi:MAG: DHA2 family efflux MFS transporter permease subunit [Spirochaetia bacterium]|jgi:EmrB/QacA subfamily drug resistance transporter